MRSLRILAANAWYHVSTAVNNREPLFWSALERARFEQVLNEARKIYVFELRGLRFCGPWVSFYIKPADGFELPMIMQWVKQTYAVRYNVYDGRTGHIWGVRFPLFTANRSVPLQTIINRIPDCGNRVNIVFYRFRFVTVCDGLPRNMFRL
jgi:REP element-mobilizing transposase RayT